MAFTVEHARRMRAAYLKAGKRTVQIGHQYCSSGHVADAGEFPVDSAAVKELYSADAGQVVGIAVYRHVTAGTTGSNWYWYERVPLDSAAPHNDAGVVADGTGGTGTANTIPVTATHSKEILSRIRCA